MLSAAAENNLDLKVRSGYRSYREQEIIKIKKIKKYGKEKADAVSADPGQSEHQLGTTVDISTKSINYSLSQSFENTPEFTWLTVNAGNYGFKLSYPKNNSHYSYEP